MAHRSRVGTPDGAMSLSESLDRAVSTAGLMPAPGTPRSPTCWVVTDGKAGTENQCIGLAEATGFTTTIKRIEPRGPWRFLPPRLGATLLGGRPSVSLARGSDPLIPPWPDLLIAGGRASVPYALAIRRLAGGATYAVQLLDPRVPPALFDLVVAPRHDHLHGPNVVTTRGALNRITPERLAEAAGRIAPALAHLPRPLVAVLIGGASRRHRFSATAAAHLADQLAALSRDSEAGLAVTLSRRTGPEAAAAIRARLAAAPCVIWDGRGDNPYFGYLGLADAVVVTGDSISMTSEACATGRPVFVAEMEGGGRKFREFHEGLQQGGLTRPFTGILEEWSASPLDETATVAGEIKARMGLAE